MTVSSTNPEYDCNTNKWKLVRDVLRSDVKRHIKDVDVADPERNKRYREDAQFTNFTGRTVSGLVGAVFRKDPIIKLPESIAYLEKDSTGDELPLRKLAQELVRNTLALGRYGLLVDFPSLPEGASITAAEAEALNLNATILRYSPESIINWHTTKVGSKTYLDLVVLKECVNEIDEDDGFEWVEKTYYRVLRLKQGEEGREYIQTLYDEDENKIAEYAPKDKDGLPLDSIPFVFVGSDDNDSKIDPSPIFDLASLNIGHLRNSADYEESIHIVGQPTLVITTDLDAEQFRAANPNGVYIGSRKGLNLGTNGKATFLQASPNQLADKAMERKEAQAVMMGARLITAQADRETAEAARMRHSGETSILNTVAKNVEAALNKCLEICLMFMSDNPERDKSDISLIINDIFFDQNVDPNFIAAQIQLVDGKIISIQNFRQKLRRLGIVPTDMTDEEIDSQIKQQRDIFDSETANDENNDENNE